MTTNERIKVGKVKVFAAKMKVLIKLPKIKALI
jgi:hypothetical protein